MASSKLSQTEKEVNKELPTRKRAKIETGKVFGYLTVIEEDGRDKHGYRFWKCKCDCGHNLCHSITKVRSNSLRQGRTKSCGALIKPRDINGQIFGVLEVVKRGENTSCGRVRWLTRCIKCRNERFVRARHLLSGATTSCPCQVKAHNRKELTGKTFWRWTVLRWDDDKWLCQCDCGNRQRHNGHTLTSGHSKSCGCYKKEITKSKFGNKHPNWKGGSVIGNRRRYVKNKDNIKFRLNLNVANAIRQSLGTNKNGCHWESLVGYSLDDLKKHLETLFKPDMNWENWGKGINDWSIDHIIPINVFNFKTYHDLDFKKCWALENLRPMWHSENIKKRDKLFKPFQPSLTLSV